MRATEDRDRKSRRSVGREGVEQTSGRALGHGERGRVFEGFFCRWSPLRGEESFLKGRPGGVTGRRWGWPREKEKAPAGRTPGQEKPC